MKAKLCNVSFSLFLALAIASCGSFSLWAQEFDFGTKKTYTLPATPANQLAWEKEHLQGNPKPTDLSADFTFKFTNISDAPIVIDHVQPSCSCTAAKLPAQPWLLPPHTNGEIFVTVNLRGKVGTFDKKLTVYYGNTNVPPKELGMTIIMPDRTKMRAENMQIAQSDRQAVFKGECAKCHVDLAQGKTGMAYFHEACGICHEARPRATMVPDLRLIKDHPTDVAFWRTNIANGKPGSLMPAFSKSQGGPLTDEEIQQLAVALDNAYPYSRFAPHPQEAAASIQQAVPRPGPAQKN